MYPKSTVALHILAVLVVSAIAATILVSQVTAEQPEPPDPLELYDANDNGVIDADEVIRATVDYVNGLIDGSLAYRVWLLYTSTLVTGQGWTPACNRYDANGNGVIEKAEMIKAINDYLFEETIDKATMLAVINCYYSGTHSIAISGLPEILQSGGSQAFSVTASNLLTSKNYTINVATDHVSIGFDVGCSTRTKNFDVTVDSDNSNAVSRPTLYACSSPGGSVTAKLSMGEGVGELVSDSHDVAVPAPTPVLPPSTPVLPPATPVPSPTPIPDRIPSLDKTTNSQFMHQGESVSRQLPAATGGDGTLTYSVTPAMGNGLSFDPATRRISGTPAAAAPTALYTYTATDADGDTTTLNLLVTVFDLSFKVVSGRKDLVDAHWGVLHRDRIEIHDSIARTDEYRFRLGIPGYPGFQVNRDTCQWPIPSQASVQWTNWASLRGGRIQMVRCGVGTGNSVGISVQVRQEEDSTNYPVFTANLTIPQAWHRNDHQVKYYISGTSQDGITGIGPQPLLGLFPSDKPSNIPDSYVPNPELLKPRNYSDATGAWNDVNAGVTISHTISHREADVLIVGYWDPNPGKGDDPKCGGSIACTQGKGIYPHLGDGQPLLIEDPPHWGSKKTSEIWTTDFYKASQLSSAFEYLPSVLVHEFGHTIGLGHSLSGDIMSGAVRELPPCPNTPGTSNCGLSDTDKNGAKGIYQSHRAH